MRHKSLAKRDSVQKLDSQSLREGHPARGKVNRWENLPLPAAGEGHRSGNLRAPAANLVGQALGEAGQAGNLDSPALGEDSQWTKQDSPAAGWAWLTLPTRMTSTVPEGPGDNSPVLQHWVAGSGAPESRRDDRNGAPRQSLLDRSSFVHAGLLRHAAPQPSAEALGYSRVSLRDMGPKAWPVSGQSKKVRRGMSVRQRECGCCICGNSQFWIFLEK